MFKKAHLFFSLIILFLAACKPEEKQENTELVIALKHDANALNPLHAKGFTANYLCMQLFQPLVGIDYQTNHLVGILAKRAPKVFSNPNGHLCYEYVLRRNAKFDNGETISASDVLFSFKLVNLEGTGYPGASSFYRFIDSIYTNKDTIRFLTQQTYFLNIYSTGDFFILPASVYDPENILEQYSLQQIRNYSEQDTLLTQFIESFNTQKFDKDSEFISGSGPYRIKQWESQDHIILERKDTWWGQQDSPENTYFQNQAKYIKYLFIPEEGTQISAFKSGQIDLLMGIEGKTLNQLLDLGFRSKKQVKTAYEYIGFNMSSKALQDLSIRRSIKEKIDKHFILEKVYQNAGSLIHHPILDSSILPQQPSSVSLDFKPSLSEHLELDLLFNTNDESRKTLALWLKQELEKSKITINLDGKEWTAYLNALRSGNFDLFIGSVQSAPIPPDFYTGFHSDNREKGRNYTNYTSREADSLIESIRACLDKKRRDSLYQAFVHQLEKDIPIICLFRPHESFVYSDRIKNLETSEYRPNFWAPSIELRP